MLLVKLIFRRLGSPQLTDENRVFKVELEPRHPRLAQQHVALNVGLRQRQTDKVDKGLQNED